MVGTPNDNIVVLNRRVEQPNMKRPFSAVDLRKAWRSLLPMGARRERGGVPAITPHIVPSAPYIVGGLLRNASSGLGSSARLCYGALSDAGLDVYGIDVTSDFGLKVNLPEYQFRDGGALAGSGTLILHVSACSMIEALKILGPRRVRDRHVIGLWAWELSEVPETWRGGSRFCHQVWALSRFSAEAFRPMLEAGQGLAVTHCPVAIRSRLSEIDRSTRPVRPFTVLSMFEMESSVARKNPFSVIEAFRKALPAMPGARLVLKIGSPQAQPRVFSDLCDLVAEMQGSRVIAHYLSDEEMVDLYREADLYISLPRSEGFGLTFVEAMLAGLPVIGTAWSGHADFMRDGIAFPVRHTLVPVEDADHYYVGPHLSWAEADTDDAARLLVALHQDANLRAAVGRDARAYALKKFGLDRYIQTVAPLLALDLSAIRVTA